MADQPEKTVGKSLSMLLGLVPNVAAATSFAVLTLAFVHEWAFYGVVGGQYQALVSITDYFNSAIGWLPWVALGFIIAMILTDPMREVPRHVKAQFYKTNRTRWVFDNLPTWSVFVLGLAGGAFQFLFGDWYVRGFLEMLFIVIWSKIFVAIARRPSLKEAITLDVAYLILFSPGFLVMAYIGGMSEAAGFLHPKREPNAIPGIVLVLVVEVLAGGCV